MSVSSAEVFTPADLPRSTMVRASWPALSRSFLNAPEPTFTSRPRPRVPSAIFFDMIDESTSAIHATVEYQEERYALFLRANIRMLFNEIHIMFAWFLLFSIVLSVIFVFLSTTYFGMSLADLVGATQRLSEGELSV